MDCTSTTSHSRKLDRIFIRDILHLVKRHKTNVRKADRNNVKPATETTVEESFNTLNVQSARLEKNLKMFVLQSKKILDDNRCIFANVIKSKKENTIKIKDVFCCAFNMLHSLEGLSGHIVDQEGIISKISSECVNSDVGGSPREYLKDLDTSSPERIIDNTRGFRRRANGSGSEILGSFRRTESNQH